MRQRILAMLLSLACAGAEESFAQLTQDWARIYPSPPGQFAEAVDVQMDAGGNIYTLGNVNNDMLLIKYNPAGDTVWTRRVTNGGRPLKLELDRNGDIVIGGGSPGVRKYSSSGSLLWMKSATGAVYVMSLDSLDNVLVGSADLIYTHARKFNSNGDSVWARRYNRTTIPTASTTDGSGNFYLTAIHNPSSGRGILIIKYIPAGDTAWTRVFSRMDFSEQATDIQIDNAGNIVIAGWASTSSQLSGKDYTVVKYSSIGALLWQRHFNGPGNGEDQINDLVIDYQDNIYATGGMTTSSGSDGVTLKLSPSGDSLWAIHAFSGLDESYSKSGFLSRQGDKIRMAVPTAGAQWVLGIDEYNAWLHKYEDALPRGATTIGSPGTETVPMGLATRRSTQDEMVVSFHRVTLSPPFMSVLHTVKFTSPLTKVDEERATPRSYSLDQNYPNPFNPSTRMGFRIQERGFVSLKVFDVLGREVAVLVNEQKAPGDYEATFNASGLSSGMYLYRLQAGSFTETRKLILIK